MQLARGSVDSSKALILIACLLSKVHGQTDASATTVKLRGRYIPELYRADRGRYIPDDSGKYRHILVPYNGGYGDRGLKYEHDDNASYKRPPEPFALGPRDHLRFMIDFNYNGTGWQIIEFDWVRDGDETKKYTYSNQNQLWQHRQYGSGNNAGQEVFEDYGYSGASIADVSPGEANGDSQGDSGPGEADSVQDADFDTQFQLPDDGTSGHLDGEYQNSQFSYNYTGEEMQQVQVQQPDQGATAVRHNAKELRDAITEILDYVKTNIIPNLP